MSAILKPNDASIVFNGSSNRMKFYYVDAYSRPDLRHMWEAHDVGVLDNSSAIAYGHDCKIPPGGYYKLGVPQECGPASEDGVAYGWWFTPIEDNAEGTLAKFGRSGLGIHGGGTGLSQPFSQHQGWEATYGCMRMQNIDNGMSVPASGSLVYSVNYVQKSGGTVYLSIYWP